MLQFPKESYLCFHLTELYNRRLEPKKGHSLFVKLLAIITNEELTKRQSTSSWHKRSEFCMAKDTLCLKQLPFNDVTEEDKQHVLITCPRFHEFNCLNLQKQTKSLLLRNEDPHELYKWEHVHLGRSVRRIFSTLFKKKGNVSKA